MHDGAPTHPNRGSPLLRGVNLRKTYRMGKVTVPVLRGADIEVGTVRIDRLPAPRTVSGLDRILAAGPLRRRREVDTVTCLCRHANEQRCDER